MERSKYISCFLIGVILFMVAESSHATSPYKKGIYTAYITGNMKEWDVIIAKMENSSLVSVEDKLELISYYYGAIGYLIGVGQEKQAKSYIDKGEKLIDEILKKNSENAAANAYKGSFLGFKMGLRKIKAITLGPESMKYIKKAYDLDSSNIQAVADKANMLYYAPKVFGGRKEEALNLYNKGIRLLEEREETDQNWFYLQLLVTLAQQYESLGQYDKADKVYQKILRKEPSFEWVKNELYPKLKQNYSPQ